MSDTNHAGQHARDQARRPADPTMRARFEAMMATKVSSLTRDPADDGYKAPDAHRAWLAWQMATEEASRTHLVPAQVHFYRRGDEKHWHKTTADHLATIQTLTGERYECATFYAGPAPAATSTADAVRAMGEGMGEGDAIERSKFILRLVDAYMERPSAETRTALRMALMHQFDRDITPQGLLDIARETGLRAHLHGVGPTAAREILATFVAAVPAAACGARHTPRERELDAANATPLDSPAP